MRKVSEAKQKAYRSLVKRRALLAFFIAHPEKMNDEKLIGTAMQLADHVADARFALQEVDDGTAASQS